MWIVSLWYLRMVDAADAGGCSGVMNWWVMFHQVLTTWLLASSNLLRLMERSKNWWIRPQRCRDAEVSGDNTTEGVNKVFAIILPIFRGNMTLVWKDLHWQTVWRMFASLLANQTTCWSLLCGQSSQCQCQVDSPFLCLHFYLTYIHWYKVQGSVYQSWIV